MSYSHRIYCGNRPKQVKGTVNQLQLNAIDLLNIMDYKSGIIGIIIQLEDRLVSPNMEDDK